MSNSTSPLIVAHRGASAVAPENTLAAFRLAWELGADLIEGDVHLSKDGRVVIHHDESTAATAGVDLPIASQTFAELQKFDVGAWKDRRWAGERIPTIDEALQTVPPGKGMVIECKCDDVAIVPPLAEAIMASSLRPEQVIIISYHERVLRAMRRRLPRIKRLLIAGFEQPSDSMHALGWAPSAAELIEAAHRAGADGVDLQANSDVINRSFVRALRDAALEFHVWTVNDDALAHHMIDLGVDSVTTDRPDWLRRIVMR